MRFLRHARLGLCLATLPLFGACATPDSGDGEPVAAVSQADGIRYGCDYSFARPSPASLTSQGFTFAARYLSNSPSKNLTAGEAQSLIAAGVDVVSNWEAAADDALSGFAQGQTDATTANQQALAAGMPPTRPIYFSVDFDASEAQQAAINDYFDGVASVIGVARAGAYGGYYVIKRLFDAGKITWGWQAYAWSGGQWDPRAQFRQIENGIDNDTLDKDQAIAADFGQWGTASAPGNDAAPRGHLDVVGCDFVQGWSQDTDQPDTAVFVDTYFDGPAGTGHGIRTTAGIARPDLCTAISSCNHGFALPSPYSLFDGMAHDVHTYGIDANGSNNAELPGSPGTLTCPITIPAGVSRWITDPTSLTAWKFDLYQDQLPATKAQADAIPHGQNMPATPQLAQATGDPAIYMVDGMFKRHVPNPDVLATWRFDTSMIAQKTAAEIAAMESGPDVRGRPTLVTDSMGRLLLIDDALPDDAPTGGAGGADDGGGGTASSAGGGAGSTSAGSNATGKGGAAGAGGPNKGGSAGKSATGGGAGHAGTTHAAGALDTDQEAPLALTGSNESGGCNTSETRSQVADAGLVLALALFTRRRRR